MTAKSNEMSQPEPLGSLASFGIPCNVLDFSFNCAHVDALLLLLPLPLLPPPPPPPPPQTRRKAPEPIGMSLIVNRLSVFGIFVVFVVTAVRRPAGGDDGRKLGDAGDGRQAPVDCPEGDIVGTLAGHVNNAHYVSG
jgi:hypothetical protein